MLMLQQYLPFTVLKRTVPYLPSDACDMLQQYLPFTVLKLAYLVIGCNRFCVATVPTVYGIETIPFNVSPPLTIWSVATVPTVYGIETL